MRQHMALKLHDFATYTAKARNFVVSLSELTGRPHEKAWKDLKYIKKNYHKFPDMLAYTLGAY